MAAPPGSFTERYSFGNTHILWSQRLPHGDLPIPRPAGDDRGVTDPPLSQGAHLLSMFIAEVSGLMDADVILERRCSACGGPHGKLYALGLDHLDSSVSYAGDWTLLAVSEGNWVGVDAERMASTEIATRHNSIPTDIFLSEAESAKLTSYCIREQAHAALDSWVRKESALKALGVGLNSDPRLTEFSMWPETPQVLGSPHQALLRNSRTISIPAPAGCVAYATLIGK
jgi:phosphopantetheinyl transferase (holo-ACP synthase)